ncbi:MAG: hypothetical protein R2737_15030 [Candidatus Nanopelagicales bacterium]
MSLSLGRPGRIGAATAAVALGAGLLLAAPAQAALPGGYTLTGPATTTVGTPTKFTIANASIAPGTGIPAGMYCVAADPGQGAATTATPTQQLPGQGNSADVTATFTAGSGQVAVTAFSYSALPGNCPTTTPYGDANATILAHTNITVGNAATGISITPVAQSAAPGAPAAFTLTYTGVGGVPVNLGPGQVATVTSSNAAVTFNGTQQLMLTFTTATPETFTVQAATANVSAVLTASLFNAGSGTPVASAQANFGTAPQGTLVVVPTVASADFGGSTTFTVTFTNLSGTPVPNVPVTVASTGRNTFATTSAGSTNVNGQVLWRQVDTAPASSTATKDTLTFTAQGASATATVAYSAPPPAASVTVTSPSNGSSISSGGLFGVSAQSTGVAAGTTAYLTLNGSAKASSTVQANGFIRFDNTSLGGGQWIPAQAGNYAVRICGGSCGPVQATSQTFSLNIIPFQIVGQPDPGAGQLDFTVATGNWQPGTTIYLTRNGLSVATGKVQQVGQQIVIQTRNLSGKYQVRVNSNQGYVYGNQAGVVTVS